MTKTVFARGSISLALALLAAFILVFVTGVDAVAKNKTNTRQVSGGTLKSYAYIQDKADKNNCGSFRTSSSYTKKLTSITNQANFHRYGFGSVSVYGVSVNGGQGSNPVLTNTNRNSTSAAIAGTVCISFATIYLGLTSTASTKINGTLWSVSVRL